MALLKRENDLAQDALSTALTIELGRSVPSREHVAWYSWQLGDTAFFTGDYAAARATYDNALVVYPGYFRALASLGRLDAAQSDYPQAVIDYTKAIDVLPDLTFVAELGDVYALSGDQTAAEREFALVDVIGRLSAFNGIMYNRQLAMFDADHDRKSTEAYQLARREYVVRRDVLEAGAVAWTALKADKLAEARAAMRYGCHRALEHRLSRTRDRRSAPAPSDRRCQARVCRPAGLESLNLTGDYRWQGDKRVAQCQFRPLRRPLPSARPAERTKISVA